MNKKPFLIAFEGMDGCGKFTQATLLKKWLEEKGKTVGYWAEPNDGSPIGKIIRDYLNKRISLAVDNHEFQRMFVIDRAQNIFSHIHDNRDKHEFKIADRFALSTVAFGMLSGRPADDYIKMHDEVIGSSMVWPDLTFVIDIFPETSIARIKGRTPGYKEGVTAPDRHENHTIQEKVRENYLALAKRSDIRKTVVLNGERSPEEISEDIKSEVSRHFGL